MTVLASPCPSIPTSETPLFFFQPYSNSVLSTVSLGCVSNNEWSVPKNAMSGLNLAIGGMLGQQNRYPSKVNFDIAISKKEAS
jgi:hypothetical protein